MPAETILVVDDDPQIGDLIEELLTREGYRVTRAYSGTEALLCLERQRPHLVLLDLMLPGLSGEEILPRLKGIPVIVLSARAAVEDKVKLLLGGAADYMTKPFATRELLARITVALRKAEAPSSGLLSWGELVLDPTAHAVTVGGAAGVAATDSANGVAVALTKTEFAILKLLMQSPRQVLAKSAILDRIAPDTPDCTESSLKTHMSHLRAKLREAGGKEYIESVWGIGFKMA